MQVLTMTRRKMELFPAEQWTPELLERESQRVRALYAAGVLRAIWRRKDMPGAVMLLEVADEHEARATVATLPLAELGMLEFVVVTGLEPYGGFAPR